MKNRDLPIIYGATCTYAAKEDGTFVVIINGNEYQADDVIDTYAIAYVKYEPMVDVDLLIDEYTYHALSEDRIEDYEVYEVYYLVEGVTIDESNRVLPHGKIIGARLLDGYDKRRAYYNMSKTREINKLLKAVVKQYQK